MCKMRVQPESHRRPQDLQSYALLLSYAPEKGFQRSYTDSDRWVLTKKSTPEGFEPSRAKHTHLAGELLNHSDKVPSHMYFFSSFSHGALGEGKRTTSAGFEPTRAEPTRFRVWRLNHSAMTPIYSGPLPRDP